MEYVPMAPEDGDVLQYGYYVAEENPVKSSPLLQETISDLIDSFNGLMKDPKSEPDKEELQTLTDTAFRSLLGNLSSYYVRVEDFQPSSINLEQAHLTNISNELKLTLLPRLRHRITSLSLALDPSDITKNPTEKFELILKLLLELKEALDPISNLFNSEESEESKNNEQEIKNQVMIRFRYERLTRQVKDILEPVHKFVDSSRLLINDLNLSNEKSTKNQLLSSEDTNILQLKQDILTRTSFSWNLIDRLIEWLDQPDCSLVQSLLQEEVSVVDDSLHELSNIIKLEPKEEEEGRKSDQSDDEEDSFNYHWEMRPLSKEMLEIANLILPIMKLSRLFLNKLSKTKSNKEAFKLISKMNSIQLGSLLNLSDQIYPRMDDLIYALNVYTDRGEVEVELDAEQRFITYHCNSILNILDSLSNLFFDCIDHALLPYFSSSSHQFDHLDILPQTWFETWKNQFSLATQKLSTTSLHIKELMIINKNHS